MKKKYLICGLAALLSVAPIAQFNLTSYQVVEAAAEINFDQGSMSDEEYVRNIIDQHLQLDALHMDYTSEEDEAYTFQADIDLKNLSMKTITSGEYGSESYSFDDGSTAMNTDTEIDMLKIIYTEYEQEIDEVAKEIEDKFILTEYPELKGQVSKMIENFKTIPDDIETYENKDGVVSAYTKEEKISENKQYATMVDIYGENATIQQGVVIDSKAKTLVFETKINVDEETMKDNESEDIGISMSELVTDSNSKITVTPSTEQVPRLEDLELITKDEINQMLEEKGIEVLF